MDRVTELFLFCGVHSIVFTSLISIVYLSCLFTRTSYSLPATIVNKQELGMWIQYFDTDGRMACLICWTVVRFMHGLFPGCL